jgi:hypothetical protein
MGNYFIEEKLKPEIQPPDDVIESVITEHASVSRVKIPKIALSEMMGNALVLNPIEESLPLELVDFKIYSTEKFFAEGDVSKCPCHPKIGLLEVGRNVYHGDTRTSTYEMHAKKHISPVPSRSIEASALPATDGEGNSHLSITAATSNKPGFRWLSICIENLDIIIKASDNEATFADEHPIIKSILFSESGLTIRGISLMSDEDYYKANLAKFPAEEDMAFFRVSRTFNHRTDYYEWRDSYGEGSNR